MVAEEIIFFIAVCYYKHLPQFSYQMHNFVPKITNMYLNKQNDR